MEPRYKLVYSEKAGSLLSIASSPTNCVHVIVREWSGDWVTDYVIMTTVVVDGKEVIRKEIGGDSLAQAVRRGIAIFDEEVAKHPVLRAK